MAELNPHLPATNPAAPELTAEERAVYDWQFPIAGLGEAGQRRLKGASVLITRVGGLGGMVALELAAAGIGRLILAHGGNLRPDDLNRQVLMTHRHVGRQRIDSAVERLKALNPRLEIVAVPSNVTEENITGLVGMADVVVDCAPLFSERYLLNRESMRQKRPMVEAAVYEMELHLSTFIPGETACLRCVYPETNPGWTRRFPVLGAVAGTAGCMAALEVIKLVAGFGDTLHGWLLTLDLRSLHVKKLRLHRITDCPDCGAL